MRVTNIDVNDLTFDGTLHRATVSMDLLGENGSDVSVHFLCKTERPKDCPSTLIQYDLMNDALRQARRMPGFRAGEEEIIVEISSAQTSVA